MHIKEIVCHLNQRPSESGILPLVEEACCATSVANSASSANSLKRKIICNSNCFRYAPVDVLVYLLGHVVTAGKLNYCISNDIERYLT